MAELTKTRLQHTITGGQGISDSRFPTTGARGIKNEYLTSAGLENLLDVFKQRLGKFGKVARTMVFEHDVHGTPNALGNIGWPWDKQVISSRHRTSSGWDPLPATLSCNYRVFRAGRLS